MIKVKSTVRPRSLWIMAAVANAQEVLAQQEAFFPKEGLVTSGNDSTHKVGSLHGKDRALDVRTKTIPNLTLKQLFVATVLKRLGKDYQGFLEDVGGVNEHAHFEHDPPVLASARRRRR